MEETVKTKATLIVANGDKKESSSWNNFNPESSDDDIAAVLNEFGKLQSKTVVEYRRTDTKSITV